jgi:hypothetical protein
MALRTGLKALFPLTSSTMPYLDTEGSGYVMNNTGMSFVSGAPGPCWQAGVNSFLGVDGVTHTYPFALGVWWKHSGSLSNGSDILSLFTGSPTDYFEITAYGGGSGHFGRARSAGTSGDSDATNWSSTVWNLSVFIVVSATERYLWQNGVLSAVNTVSVNPAGSLNRFAIGALRGDTTGSFAPSGVYYKYAAIWEGSVPTDTDLDTWLADPAIILPAIVPTLSSPVGVATGGTTANVGFTTDQGNGTGYVVVTTSATQPSIAQIKAGQNHLGAAAAFAANSPITSAGAIVYPATGLVIATGYYSHSVQNNPSGDSNRVSSALFTTDNPGTGGGEIPGSGGGGGGGGSLSLAKLSISMKMGL